jgi:chromosome segregation ATPase
MVTKKRDSVEVFNEAVDKLITKLENINDNLASQVQQNKQLVERMDTLPGMLSGVPKAIDEQRQAFAQVAEQLRQKVARDEKVAEELCGIHEKVAAAAEVDAKMCDNFSTFSETLSKLDNDTVTQTEWLEQMSRTFSASERYLKYAMAKQQVRFYWILGISLGISLLAVAAMVVGIILLKGGNP